MATPKSESAGVPSPELLRQEEARRGRRLGRGHTRRRQALLALSLAPSLMALAPSAAAQAPAALVPLQASGGTPTWVWAALLMAAFAGLTVLTMVLARLPVRRPPPPVVPPAEAADEAARRELDAPGDTDGTSDCPD